MEEKFVERLRELLARENIKQKDLAQDVGITEAALSRYMKGDRIPHGETICNLATALHTTTDYLLGRKDKEEFNKEISFNEMEGLLARNSKNYSNKQNDELMRIILKNK
ncbi:MAG: helix-turn-helix transcriptional regulator [Bacilli bacterium]|nr:helix-turn-helix transcriptional regulator [Bacilli bacterium]